MRGIREIQKEIDKLTGYWEITRDPRVQEVINKIIKENAPRVEALKKELEEVRNGKPKPKPRWPENTPENVLAVCEKYWRGTEEFSMYRIHCWNDKYVWTSYPARAWYCQGVRHQGKATFDMLSLTEFEFGRPKVIKMLDGKVSLQTMQQEL